jgi:hypothetical protein
MIAVGKLAALVGEGQGLRNVLWPTLWAISFCSAGAAYFFIWRMSQVLWNAKFCKPTLCRIRLDRHKDSGIQRGTWILLVELQKVVRFGETTFAWEPQRFLA